MTTRRRAGQKTAAKIQLLEGEDSISPAKPSILEVNGVRVKVLHWSVRPEGYARPLSRRTQVTVSTTDGELRRRARATAEKILAKKRSRDQWIPTSSMADFIKNVVQPSVENDPKLMENAKARYVTALRYLRGDCSGPRCKHAHSFKLLQISTAVKYLNMAECLQEIARRHGYATAKACRSVLSGYVIRAPRERELLIGNPLIGARLDLQTDARPNPRQRPAGYTPVLSKDEFKRAVDYLLTVDPAEGVAEPKRGRYTWEDRVANRRLAIKTAFLQASMGLLLQASMGLRIA